WIGRQGQGAQAWTSYWLTPRNKIQFSYRHQKVSQEFIPGGGTLSDVSVSADFWVRPSVRVVGSVQYENWTFPVLWPVPRNNVMSSVQVSFSPGAWRTGAAKREPELQKFVEFAVIPTVEVKKIEAQRQKRKWHSLEQSRSQKWRQ